MNTLTHGSAPPRPQCLMIGVCDLGTFSGLILIAQFQRSRWKVVAEEQHTVDLLRGVDHGAEISSDGVARARKFLRRFQWLLRKHHCDRAGVVSTAAMRDAPNRDAVLESLRKTVKAPVVVLSARREAMLTVTGAQIGLRGVKRPSVFIDIGGGSTEIMRSGADRWSFRGFNLGAAKAAQQWTTELPRSKKRRAGFYRERVDEILMCLNNVRPVGEARLVGIGGTIVTLAAIKRELTEFDPARLHATTLSRTWIEKQAVALAEMGQREIAGLIPFDPKRARILTAGTFLWSGVLNRVDAKSVTVSARGLRWGVAAALARGRRL